MIKNSITDSQHTWIMAYLIKYDIEHKNLSALITLDFQVAPIVARTETLSFQSLSCHIYDGSQMERICHKQIQQIYDISP